MKGFRVLILLLLFCLSCTNNAPIEHPQNSLPIVPEKVMPPVTSSLMPVNLKGKDRLALFITNPSPSPDIKKTTQSSTESFILPSILPSIKPASQRNSGSSSSSSSTLSEIIGTSDTSSSPPGNDFGIPPRTDNPSSPPVDDNSPLPLPTSNDFGIPPRTLTTGVLDIKLTNSIFSTMADTTYTESDFTSILISISKLEISLASENQWTDYPLDGITTPIDLLQLKQNHETLLVGVKALDQGDYKIRISIANGEIITKTGETKNLNVPGPKITLNTILSIQTDKLTTATLVIDTVNSTFTEEGNNGVYKMEPVIGAYKEENKDIPEQYMTLLPTPSISPTPVQTPATAVTPTPVIIPTPSPTPKHTPDPSGKNK